MGVLETLLGGLRDATEKVVEVSVEVVEDACDTCIGK